MAGDASLPLCCIPGCTNPRLADRRMCAGHKKRWSSGKRGADLLAPIVNCKIDIAAEVEKANEPPPPPDPSKTYDSIYDRYCAWMGMFKKFEHPCPVNKGGSCIVHGAISDLHIPFQNDDAVREGLAWLLDNGVTHLHIVGDFFDCYSVSRFNQYKSVPIREEFIAGRKILQWCSEHFVQVEVLEGNHEARERKYLSARLPPDLFEWYLTKSIMQHTAEDLPNVTICHNQVQGTDMMWLSQVGRDCVIGHPETSSKIPMRPVDNFKKWLDDWHSCIGMDRPRFIIIGHTHAAGMASVGQRMVVETGCLCLIQGYALEPRLFPKPQNLAVTTWTQNDGITNINTVRQYYPCQQHL